MIHIAICDDDIQLCNQLEDYIRKWRKEGRKLEAEVFNTGKEFDFSGYHHEGLQWD